MVCPLKENNRHGNCTQCYRKENKRSKAGQSNGADLKSRRLCCGLYLFFIGTKIWPIEPESLLDDWESDASKANFSIWECF